MGAQWLKQLHCSAPGNLFFTVHSSGSVSNVAGMSGGRSFSH